MLTLPNSITQGEQVPILWKPLMELGVFINFGVPTFKWSNEAKGKAAVHCVIIGFSFHKTKPTINPYLAEAPVIFIESRGKPICDAPEMLYGSMPIDNGALILSVVEMETLKNTEPLSSKFIRRYSGGNEFLNNTRRYCLWLKGAAPNELRASKFITERIAACKDFREKSARPQTKILSDMPHLFGEVRQPETDMLLIPKVSSENRKYLPLGFVSREVIVNGSALIIPGAAKYHFGVLSSNVHNAWMRAVGGRMKSDYQYSNTLVYNNFPWPDATDAQKANIEKLAQGILDARALFPESSLADLYDPLTMPPELLKAHNALDAAVMKLYGFSSKMTEAEIVAALMERYQELVTMRS